MCEHDAQPEPARRRVGWLRVLAAPWVGIVRPITAASWLRSGSPAAFVLAFAPVVIVLTAVSVGVTTVGGSARPPETAAALQYDGTLAFAVTAFVVTASVLVTGVFAVAWLCFPLVHRSGSVWASFAHTLRSVFAASGTLTLLFAVFRLAFWYTNRVDGDVTPYVIVAAMASILAFVGLVGWIVERSPRDPPDALPPMCEDCGYDLTFVPESGRCSECGSHVDRSLTPGLRRPGCAWESGDTLGAWAKSSFAALIAPSRFYGSLKMRSGISSARLLSRMHYVAIGLSGSVWMVVLQCSDRFPGVRDTVLSASLLLFTVPISGWCVHRAIAALVTIPALVRGDFRDFRYASKIVAYEAVYLWVFCAVNGSLITALEVLPRIVNWRVPFRLITGITVVDVCILGNAGLCIVWVFRYRIARDAARWSNF